MDFLKMAASALGLTEKATEAEVLVAIATNRRQASEVGALSASAGSLTEIVALTGKASAGDAKGVIMAWKNSHDQMSVFLAEKKVKDDAERETSIIAMVDGGVVNGQITPAMKAFWIEAGRKDISSLKTYLEAAAKGPTPAGANPIVPKPTDGSVPLFAVLVSDEEQEKMFKVAGITDQATKDKVRKETSEQSRDLARVGIKISNDAPKGAIRGM